MHPKRCVSHAKRSNPLEKNKTKLLQGKYGFKVNISASSLCIAYSLCLRNTTVERGEMKMTKGETSGQDGG